MTCIRVLVASHIRLYCEGLERVLRESPEFALVGTAFSAAETVEQTHKLAVDVALLDMAMNGAFAVAKEVARVGTGSKVVALGGNLAGQLSGEYDSSNLESLPGLFLKLFWWGAVGGVVMLALNPLLKRWSAGVK